MLPSCLALHVCLNMVCETSIWLHDAGQYMLPSCLALHQIVCLNVVYETNVRLHDVRENMLPSCLALHQIVCLNVVCETNLRLHDAEENTCSPLALPCDRLSVVTWRVRRSYVYVMQRKNILRLFVLTWCGVRDSHTYGYTVAKRRRINLLLDISPSLLSPPRSTLFCPDFLSLSACVASVPPFQHVWTGQITSAKTGVSELHRRAHSAGNRRPGCGIFRCVHRRQA